MRERKLQILLAIAESFISSAAPIGSQSILRRYKFNVSPATVRNDMAELEEQNYISQPHTSAGRVPTNKGYRYLFDIFKEEIEEQVKAAKDFEKQYSIHLRNKTREKMYDSVALLAQVTGNVSFATLPENNQTIFLGVSNVLKQPEFYSNPAVASQVVEVLEKDFITLLDKLDIPDDDVSVYIGEENMINQFQSCTLMVAQYYSNGEKGYFGILGPTRMKYTYNYSAIRCVKKVLEQ
jgi:transcriptional regulator of heat shock response